MVDVFEHIIGHEKQKEFLLRAVRADRLAHAFLFEGPEGVGKRLMATALARALFCDQKLGCGDCVPCRKVIHSNHPDFHLLEPDGALIKIEQIRELQKDLSYRPLEAPRKFCIIDGADKMNPAAGNALLKTLEEPQGDALLILLTSHPEGVLDTIHSRCQSLPFGRLHRDTLKKVLQDRLGLGEVQGHILAALSEGSFKKALGRDRDLFLERRKTLLAALTALSPGSILPLFELAGELSGEKEQLQDILEIIQAFFRDLLLLRLGAPEQDLVNIDLMQKIRRVAAKEDIPSLLRKLNAIEEGRRQIMRNVNKELALDVLFMRLAA